MRLPLLKITFLFFFLSSINSQVFSQQISILNSKTKKGVEGVFIYNISKTINVITDVNGGVDISEFKKNDTLILTHQNYTTFLIPVVAIDNNTVYLEEQHFNLQTVEITAKLTKEKAFEAISKVDKIDAKTIRLNNPQTSADLLELNGGVFVQKSQLGGGSPIIRGFEANRVLLVIDGVRLNNAIYRSGHLQNAITVDNAVLDKTDIIYGANSVIYGSDAIGGVVHYRTKAPQFRHVNDTFNNNTVNAYIRHSTASNEKTGHIDFNLGNEKVAALTSITFSDFDDLTIGKTANPDYPEFGIFREYAGRINGTDTALIKRNIFEQIGTGYSQTDVLQKISYRFSKKVTLNLNTQFSTSSNVPRYDQLTDFTGGGRLKWAEWYYGPQNRLLTALSTKIKSDGKLFNEVQFLASYQKIDEDRITRRFKNDNRITREEDVTIYGFNADFLKKNDNRSEWFYGIELFHNTVKSSAFSENIITLERSIAATRYPDDGSRLSTAAIYLSFKKNISEKLTYSIGSRYSFSSLNAEFVDTTFIQLPFEEVTLNNGALTGSAGLAFRPNDKWKINIATSTAFRSPNVDDVGKVFSRSDFVIIPNDQLTPEYAYNGELSVTKSFMDNKLNLNVVGFFTFLNDALVRDFFQLDGLDSLEYEGETLKIQANTNATEAIVYGYSLKVLANVTKEFNIKSSLSYTFGENTTQNVPLAHIPPIYGRTDFIFEHKSLIASFYTKYQGLKRIEDFAPSGEDNQDKATIDGTPSWYTLNINTSLKINKSFTIQAAIENILDIHYRTFASGVSAPGRNFIFTLRATL